MHKIVKIIITKPDGEVLDEMTVVSEDNDDPIGCANAIREEISMNFELEED